MSKGESVMESMRNTAQRVLDRNPFATIGNIKAAGGVLNSDYGLWVFQDGSAGCFCVGISRVVDPADGAKFFEFYCDVNGRDIRYSN